MTRDSKTPRSARMIGGGRRDIRRWLAMFALGAMTTASVAVRADQLVQPAQPPTPPTKAAPIERLGPNLVRVGNVRVDLERKTVSAPGVIGEAQTLEFVAVTKGGYKAYESAIELDTNAINFNLGLLLIGLDPAHAVVPRFHFDSVAPSGDPVEIWVEWDEQGRSRRVRAEQLIYSEIAKKTLTEGPWVYTGSVFSAETGAFLADVQGPIIGFVHTPAPLIESPRPFSPIEYGSVRLNPEFNLKPGTEVMLTVRALPPSAR